MMLQIVLTAAATIALAFGLGAFSGRRKFLLLLLGYALVLSVASGLSIASSYPGGVTTVPYLVGSDGEGYYTDALNLLQAGIGAFKSVITINYAGYQIYLALWFSVFGASLGTALVANHFLLMLSALCFFRATEILTGSRDAAFLACVLMMLTSSHIFHSLIVLKEPAINLAFSLLLLSVALALRQRHRGVKALLLFLVALAVLVMMRATLLLFVAILLSFLATLFARRRAWMLVVLLVMWALILPYADTFSNRALDTESYANTMMNNTVLSEALQSGKVETEGVIGQVSDFYLGLPIALRLVLFAVPTTLQMLLPFNVWDTDFLSDHFSLFFSRNANVVWLLFVAPWMLFAVTRVRRLQDPLLARLLLAGVGYYAIVAVIYGGAIPRYGAGALYFIYPAAGYWWYRLRTDPPIRGQVYGFFRLYFALACASVLLYAVFKLMHSA